MPELPETETIARDLSAVLVGRTIQAVEVLKPDVLRGATERSFSRRIRGSKIGRTWRRAKAVVLDLDSGDHLVVVPRFTGRLTVGTAVSPDPYAAIRFTLDNGTEFRYSDIRRLGTVSLLDHTAFTDYDQRLGVEPLEQGFGAFDLARYFRRSQRAVKTLLMDQRKIAGLGNIYANESLWLAGIDPSRSGETLTDADIGRLREAVVNVLNAAVEARGTTFRDYRDARGERGRFAERLAVYGRAGLACRRCGTRLAGTHAVDGRATVFCFRCQR